MTNKRNRSVLLSKLILVIVIILGCSSKQTELKLEDMDLNKALFEAVDRGDATMLAKILQDKPSLELKNDKGRTALMEAVYKSDNKIAILLINAGADVNAQDGIKNSPFLYAGAEGNLEIVKMALNHGANFKIYNRYGGTALIPAAEKGHLEIVKLLVNTAGFPKDHINNLGWTALLEAVLLSDGGQVHIDIVAALIEGGCDVNITDKNGMTPLRLAKKQGYAEMVKLLEKAGAK
ncbi:ankyrin repeat domain-containing protein [Flavobacterium hiemivividum]|uniref:Ankyrin repeat domain-containing protein n=1 Tax=Flavobacterium hiemivividum TaxID=2541734 RepID=A0A4R5CYP3_9FLAO|nr:ankyrin repeat domain-containing protein [Flavobacterium hiemivividum]TDE04650.1 ankyrin repeat domain-containing protein [Flavobacterium hiemivividum]